MTRYTNKNSSEKIHASGKEKNQKTAEAEKAIDETAKSTHEAMSKEKKHSSSSQELETLHLELAEARDRGLRALAELENYRNRMNRIMAEDRKYASMDIVRALLPVWDNMGRAIEAAEKDSDSAALIDGVKMMHKEFVDILQKNHVEKIEALHQPFDPNFHESIASIPTEEYPVNTVIFESQTGFKLYDRVVRPSQVVLAAPVPDANREKADSENEE